MVNLQKSYSTRSTVELNFADQIKQKFEDGFTFAVFMALVIKLALVAAAPASLVMYEKYNKMNLTREKNQVQGELSDKQNELKKIEKQLLAYSGSHKKQKEFADKKEILQKLAQSRLTAIRILDNIQTAIGGRQEVEEGASKDFIFFDKVDVSTGNLNISGSASDETVIDHFVKDLQSSPIYQSIKWEDVTSNQQNNLKNFRVTGKVKKEES